MMKLLAIFAAYMLQVASVIIAVDVPIFGLSAMVAFTNNDILVRLIDRYGNTLINIHNISRRTDGLLLQGLYRR